MNKLFYGGDYNPDQWPFERMDEDIKLFHEAGINILTLPVFSWAKLQPSENVYTFEWLDRVMDKISEEEIDVCLATSTGVQPAWMSRKYPDILPVDIQGRKRKFGGRVNYCPNNPDFRRLAGELVKRMAQRYGKNPHVKIWHVGNEYDNWCYCETCEAKFRLWLKERYGSLEALNQAWYTSFWGHTFHDWEEIVAPSLLSEFWEMGGKLRSNFQSISLDYARFMNESILGCYQNEYNILKEMTPDIPVTTNLMGYFKPLDYFQWAKHMDIISWDSYPGYNDPLWYTSLWHDMMRSLKKGQPFLLMEQSPNQQNWSPYNVVKAPGVLRLQSWQAVAHGSDSVMYFQMHRSAGSCEKLHAAVIEHAGHGNTRVFRECSGIGEELAGMDTELLGSRIKAKAAILFDWEVWWSLDYSSGPSEDLDYIQEVKKWYRYFNSRNQAVDFLHPDSDYSDYDVIIAPSLYLVSEANAGRLEVFSAAGGTVIVTFLSGIVNGHDRVYLGGYPGPLRKLLGLWVEEFDALPPGKVNSAVTDNEVFGCSLICDIMHLEGAESLATYGDDFYAGSPVLTENSFGKGKALYVGSSLDERGINFILDRALEKVVKPFWAGWNIPEGVEVTLREKEGTGFLFILNYNSEPIRIYWNQDSSVISEGERLLGSDSVVPTESIEMMPYAVEVIRIRLKGEKKNA